MVYRSCDSLSFVGSPVCHFDDFALQFEVIRATTHNFLLVLFPHACSDNRFILFSLGELFVELHLCYVYYRCIFLNIEYIQILMTTQAITKSRGGSLEKNKGVIND